MTVMKDEGCRKLKFHQYSERERMFLDTLRPINTLRVIYLGPLLEPFTFDSAETDS